MTRVKICGLTRKEDIFCINKAMPDYIGFVFAKSRRQVSNQQAFQLKGLLDQNIKAVGVFVNESKQTILDICNNGIINIIQLHGDEDADYIKHLKEKTSCPIIKAIRVKSSTDIEKAKHLPCDRLLLDTYQKDAYGGCGAVFDWSLIPRDTKPYFLAGGLSPENIEEAISTLHPYAVDISSGVETDGYKDPQKILKLMERIRSVNEHV